MNSNKIPIIFLYQSHAKLVRPGLGEVVAQLGLHFVLPVSQADQILPQKILKTKRHDVVLFPGSEDGLALLEPKMNSL